MSDVPMPRDLSEEAVARMLRAVWIADEPIPSAGSFDEIGPLMRKAWMATARAVLAWGREKVREAVAMTQDDPGHVESVRAANAIVSRVLGDHPSEARRGHGEPSGRDEVTRG